MRSFIKQVSIYGILPVVGKFAGFFLVPIYARVFSSAEFGMVELLVTLAHFLMLACNLEFYTAIGRFFYDTDSLIKRRELISTGLVLTLFFTVVIVAVALLSENSILSYYFKGDDYRFEFRLSIIWIFFNAIYTYLGVIPRYDKRPKLYVIITVTSLLVRIASTIIYVLVFKWGITGVLAGHITGSIVSTVLNFGVSSKYISLQFNWQYAKKIIKFAIPITPGLFLVGLWQPLSRNLVAQYFSLEVVGLLAFALRITALMAILNSAINLAWNPMLFEDYKKPDFKKNLVTISDYVGIAVFWMSASLTLLSPEITQFIGTAEYSDSSILIGFFAFQGGLLILRQLRGFGPLILNKTHILTINEIVGIILGFSLLLLLKDFGLVGLGLSFLLPSLVQYALLVYYTTQKIKVRYINIREFILMLSLVLAIITIVFSANLAIRYALLASITIFAMFTVNGIYKKVSFQGKSKV